MCSDSDYSPTGNHSLNLFSSRDCDMWQEFSRKTEETSDFSSVGNEGAPGISYKVFCTVAYGKSASTGKKWLCGTDEFWLTWTHFNVYLILDNGSVSQIYLKTGRARNVTSQQDVSGFHFLVWASVWVHELPCSPPCVHEFSPGSRASSHSPTVILNPCRCKHECVCLYWHSTSESGTSETHLTHTFLHWWWELPH